MYKEDANTTPSKTYIIYMRVRIMHTCNDCEKNQEASKRVCAHTYTYRPSGHACTSCLRVLRARARRCISLHQLLQHLHMIKFYGVRRRRYRGSPRRFKLHEPCKCDYDDIMRRSTPTRRTTQAAWLMSQSCYIGSWTTRPWTRRHHPHIYTNTPHGEVKRRSKTTTAAAESEVLCELAHGDN
jgi:hypothetical protein